MKHEQGQGQTTIIDLYCGEDLGSWLLEAQAKESKAKLSTVLHPYVPDVPPVSLSTFYSAGTLAEEGRIRPVLDCAGGAQGRGASPTCVSSLPETIRNHRQRVLQSGLSRLEVELPPEHASMSIAEGSYEVCGQGWPLCNELARENYLRCFGLADEGEGSLFRGTQDCTLGELWSSDGGAQSSEDSQGSHLVRNGDYVQSEELSTEEDVSQVSFSDVQTILDLGQDEDFDHFWADQHWQDFVSQSTPADWLIREPFGSTSRS